jgi:hypothetical protein
MISGVEFLEVHTKKKYFFIKKVLTLQSEF